ncbi:MAG: hypothetical protein LAP85_27315 [Acidobacteriia bacterium]|nr:hypothetical protein [Terriglobia bacterium]
MSKCIMVRITAALSMLAVFFLGYSVWMETSAASLKPAELVQWHVASIGTPEARVATRNRVVNGTAQIIFRLGGKGQAQGQGSIVSEGGRIRLQMLFGALEYTSEDFRFDGSHVYVGFISPGVRSRLGDFVFGNDILLREGLLGGILSTAWPLLDLDKRQPKLEYTGLKNQAGRKLHELKYKARKGGGDLQVWLYFDPETYRHMRTRYKLVMMAPMATRYDQSSQQLGSTFTLTEDFSDFRVFDGLTLPCVYRLNLAIEQQTSAFLSDWSITVSQIMRNQQLDPNLFSVR